MKTEGSIILMLLFVVTICTSLGIKRLFESSLMLDVIKKRELRERAFRLNDALINYGINVCTHNYEAVVKKCTQQSANCEVAFTRHDYTGTISIASADNASVKISAHLFAQQQRISNISCCLTRLADRTFSVSAWQYGN